MHARARPSVCPARPHVFLRTTQRNAKAELRRNLDAALKSTNAAADAEIARLKAGPKQNPFSRRFRSRVFFCLLLELAMMCQQ